jgi:hypothetical protein
MTRKKLGKEKRSWLDPKAYEGRLKGFGGSQSDHWNSILANLTIETLWLGCDEETRDRQCGATLGALSGIGPRDELEGMIAAQLIASHNASMECYRRAMIRDQSFESRRENLAQASKLSRTHATLLEALNRHRGKGQQKVTVEHVHVHSGGQAVVGVVEAPGGGDPRKAEDQTHAKQVAYAPQPTMRGASEEREQLPIAGDDERPLPDARRNIAGRS